MCVQQNRSSPCSAVEGQLYRHYKGGIYAVICIASHTETEEDLVVYKDVHSGKVWARPVAMWDEFIPDNNCRRFTLINKRLEET